MLLLILTSNICLFILPKQQLVPHTLCWTSMPWLDDGLMRHIRNSTQFYCMCDWFKLRFSQLEILVMWDIVSDRAHSVCERKKNVKPLKSLDLICSVSVYSICDRSHIISMRNKGDQHGLLSTINGLSPQTWWTGCSTPKGWVTHLALSLPLSLLFSWCNSLPRCHFLPTSTPT